MSVAKIEKVQAGWKVQALGLTGWLTKREYEECSAAWSELVESDEQMEDAWMMYVDMRWNRVAGGDHDRAVASAKRWMEMMTGRITEDEYVAKS